MIGSVSAQYRVTGRVNKQTFVRGFGAALPGDLAATIEMVGDFESTVRSMIRDKAEQTRQLLETR